jgi:hypothetical protein
MASAKARIDALARRMGEQEAGTGRLICIHAADLDWKDHVPGTIDAWPDGSGIALIVGHEFAHDPIGGLTAAQRAVIRRGDLVTVHAYAERADGSVATGYECRWGDPIPDLTATEATGRGDEDERVDEIPERNPGRGPAVPIRGPGPAADTPVLGAGEGESLWS